MIKHSSSTSTVIVDLEKAFRSGTVIREARLPTKSATAIAASSAISGVAHATPFAPLESAASP